MSFNYQIYPGFHPDLNEGPVDLTPLLDHRGHMLRSSLFCDIPPFSPKAIYSLKERNNKGLPSAYLIYMNSVDEYEAALKLVGSLAHWDALVSAKWFYEPSKYHRGLVNWRLDMARRNASLGNKVLMVAAREGDASAARKILDNAEKLLATVPTKGPGRPSPKKAKAAAEQEAKQNEDAAAIKALHERLKIGEE